MRLARFAIAAAALAFAGAAQSPAQAEVNIRVDKSAQIMTVDVDGSQRYVWPVSTGLPQHDTPAGEFKPFRMEKDHFSREWDDAPMPHSIFFTQEGHAIHGSGHTKNLGRPASHGCVRLSPANAATLYALVRQEKMANTHITLVGEVPRSNELVARRGDNNIIADEDVTGTVPQPRKLRVTRDGWQEIPNQRGYSDARGFYYGERSSYARRDYRYGYGGMPFGW